MAQLNPVKPQLLNWVFSQTRYVPMKLSAGKAVSRSKKNKKVENRIWLVRLKIRRCPLVTNFVTSIMKNKPNTFKFFSVILGHWGRGRRVWLTFLKLDSTLPSFTVFFKRYIGRCSSKWCPITAPFTFQQTPPVGGQRLHQSGEKKNVRTLKKNNINFKWI